MFVVRYTKAASQDGTGTIYKRSKDFDDLKSAEKFRSSLADSLAISNVQLLTDVIETIDYKTKFEELYNHVLEQAGVRKAVETANPVKPEKTKTTVKD